MAANQTVTIVIMYVTQAASPVVVSAQKEANLPMESAKRSNAFPKTIANVRMEKSSFVQRVKSYQVYVLRMNHVKCMKRMANF